MAYTWQHSAPIVARRKGLSSVWYARDPLEEIDYFLLVVREALGVELLADCRIPRRIFPILIENPFERRAVADPEGPSFISRTVAYRRVDRRYS